MSHVTSQHENNYTAKTVHALSRNPKAFYRKYGILGFSDDCVRLVQGIRWNHCQVRLLKNR